MLISNSIDKIKCAHDVFAVDEANDDVVFVFFAHLVLISSLLMIANSDGGSPATQYRTLFDFPSDALSVNDLEGQEAELLPNVQQSR